MHLNPGQRLLCAALLAATLCLLLTAGMAHAQQQDEYGRWENGVSEPWGFDPAPMTKEEIKTAQSRWVTIEAERQDGSADEWAGVYFIGGDTHGSYLSWSPQAGFVTFNVDKCRVTVMNLDYGKATASQSLVQFFPELNKRTSGHAHAHGSPQRSLRMVPVKWEGRRYLVSEDRIGEVGDYIAGLGKYNVHPGMFFGGTDFFVQLGGKEDAASKASFLPIMPPGYERFVKQPVDAVITGIGKEYVCPNAENEWWDDLTIPVTLNVGRAHGVTRGMKLLLVGPPHMEDIDITNETIEVTKVGPRSSSGIIVRSTRKRPCVKISKADDCQEPADEKLVIGRRASTSAFRR